MGSEEKHQSYSILKKSFAVLCLSVGPEVWTPSRVECSLMHVPGRLTIDGNKSSVPIGYITEAVSRLENVIDVEPVTIPRNKD